MNFLALCKKARHEARIPGTGPSSVTGQSGVLQDVVSAVSRSWIEIQQSQIESWLFMGAFKTATLTDGVYVYAPNDFGIDENVYDSLRWVKFSKGSVPLRVLSWEEYQEMYAPYQGEVSGTPVFVTQSPDNKLYFYPTPDANSVARSLIVYYTKQPVVLTNNDDTPNIAERHQWAIIWAAVMDLASNESDSVIYQKAKSLYEQAMADMNIRELPPIELGGLFGHAT